jgi:hypothetical protein
MASGRMLQRKISSNKQLPHLMRILDERLGAPHGAMASLLYTWSIAHLDAEGRMHGDVHVVKGQVVPRIAFITTDLIETYLLAMEEVGLVVYYEADDDRWLSFPGFDRNQPNLRKDRESKSTIPTPEHGKRVLRDDRGDAPAGLRQSAGEGPAEEKRREEKEYKAPPRAHACDWKELQGAWLAATGNIGANGLHDVGLRCEEHAPLVGMTPNEYADKAFRAFAEWVDGCPAAKRPQKSPQKFIEHFARVHEMVTGKRKPVEPASEPAEPPKPNRPPLVSELRYRDDD